MDETIRKIYSSLNRNDLLVVLSDHGMANEGGHGGSSQMETLTPAIFISKSDANKPYLTDLPGLDQIKSSHQIDLVSTLSCLFDLSIPVHNRGLTFINALTSHLEPFHDTPTNIRLQVKSFKCLNENLWQLNDLFKIVDSNKDMASDAKNLNEIFMKTLNADNVDFKKLKELNLKFEKSIRNRLSQEKDTNSINKTQAFLLLLAIVFMLTVIAIFNH